MNLLLLLETLKFHRIRQEAAVRILFLVCYLANIGVYFFPGSDPDLTSLITALEALAMGENVKLVVTEGNLLFAGLSVTAMLVTMLCTFIYAALFAGDREGRPTREIVNSIIKAIPNLILCGVLLLVPIVFSAFLLFIPMFIILTAIYFLPMNLILGRMKLTEAMTASIKDTRHAKMIIFLQYTMLMIVMNLPESLLVNILPISGIAAVLIAAFFISAQALMRGRLMGIFYLNLVKKVPIVIPSKPKA